MGGCKISKWYVRKISETGGERPGGKRLRVGEWGGVVWRLALLSLFGTGEREAISQLGSDRTVYRTGLSC